jgi:hypothetical protein
VTRRVLALPLALAIVSLAGSSAWGAGPTWSVASSDNPSDQANYLTAATVLTATDAWAVGAWYRPISTPGTLTEHWDGAAWTAVPSPNATAGYNELYDVDAVATDDVWAVGYHNIANYGSEKSMTLHWNGTSWSIVRSANIGPNANILRGVAAASSNDVWAVGLANSTSLQSGRPLVEHWDGTAWSLARSPKTGQAFAQLEAVAVISTSDVWAVGGAGGRTLVEHWDGTAWRIVSSPNGPGGSGELSSVSAFAANDVWAVGTSGGKTLAEHWDGTAWTVVSSPNGSLPSSSLAGVVTLSPSDVWAVGISQDQVRVLIRTLTLHWDGSSWSVVTSPNPGPDYNGLDGVAGLSGGDVWAVGNQDDLTLAMRTSD